MTNALHRTARALAEKGMAILPCVARGKVPATPHGVKDATADAATIDAWWRLLPEANIGIACGAASGIFVVDIDGDDGEATMGALEAERGELPPTVEAITGNGRHCYFRLGDHAPVGNSAGRIGPGVDTRGEGGYVLAPPSIHPTGRTYQWSVDTAADFADAPDWLHAMLASRAAPKPACELKVSATVAEGTRNDTLARLAGHLLRRRVNPRMVLALMQSFNATNCMPSLPEAEVTTTFESIARAEARRRGLIRE